MNIIHSGQELHCMGTPGHDTDVAELSAFETDMDKLRVLAETQLPLRAKLSVSSPSELPASLMAL